MNKEHIKTVEEYIEFLNEYVIAGKMILLNTITNITIDVNTSNVKEIAIMLHDMAKGHGVGHLEFTVI